MSRTVTIECSECRDAFVVPKKSANKETCSEKCKTDRDNRIRRYRYRLATQTDLLEYPISLPSMGLRREELKAMRDATWDAYLRRRPVSGSSLEDLTEVDDMSSEDLCFWNEDEDDRDETDDGIGYRDESEPGYRPSVVHRVAEALFERDPEIPAETAVELLTVVAPHEPQSPLFGLATELLRLDYARQDHSRIVSNPSASWDGSGWTLDDSFDRDEEQDKRRKEFLRYHAIPLESISVGSTVPEVRTIGGWESHRDTYTKPKYRSEYRAEPMGSFSHVADSVPGIGPNGWPLEDVEEFIPGMLGCSVTRLEPLNPFVWQLAA